MTEEIKYDRRRFLVIALRIGVFAVAVIIAILALMPKAKPSRDRAPVFGVTIPENYRKWELIAPAREAEPLNELRVVVGNSIAVEAYRKQNLPFPDGTVLVKLAWKEVQSTDFEPASVPGGATTVQVMVKDSKKYAATGGWGFGRFINGKPADEAQHQTCFVCHAARVKERDYVFTKFAP